MSDDRKDIIIMAVLSVMFAASIGGLVNALYLQEQREAQPQGYSISIQYVPAPQSKETNQ